MNIVGLYKTLKIVKRIELTLQALILVTLIAACFFDVDDYYPAVLVILVVLDAYFTGYRRGLHRGIESSSLLKR